MNESFAYGDLIILAAIVAFIFLRYRAMLGEKRGHDGSAPPPPAARRPQGAESEEQGRVLQLPQRPQPTRKPSPSLHSYAPALESEFTRMRAIDKQFSPEIFLEGASAAFDMVLEASNAADRETLKELLSPSVYGEFETVLAERERSGRIPHTTLVAIQKKNITAASLAGNIATLTVEFVSEQIHLVRDAQGNVLEGDASAVEVVEDAWQFERDLTSSAPNWLITAT